jgi:hypothetical protein
VVTLTLVWTEHNYDIIMKTLIFALLFLLGGALAIHSFLQADLMGLGFWCLVAYVSHKLAWGK